MSDRSNRFDGLAQRYDQFRPSYPTTAVDFIMARCGLEPGMRFIDIGCGTGISTRLFASRNLTGIGIEPGDDMRRQAESIPGPIVYRRGTADATGLPEASAELVLAAQAFHWFASDAALREFRRLLVPNGWLALIWNDVDRADPFSGAFAGALVHYSPEPNIARWIQSETGAMLMTSPLFERPERCVFPNEQRLDLDQLIGRAFTASFAPKQADAKRGLETALRAIFDQYQTDGVVTMRYNCVVYVAQRPAP